MRFEVRFELELTARVLTARLLRTSDADPALRSLGSTVPARRFAFEGGAPRDAARAARGAVAVTGGVADAATAAACACQSASRGYVISRDDDVVRGGGSSAVCEVSGTQREAYELRLTAANGEPCANVRTLRGDVDAGGGEDVEALFRLDVLLARSTDEAAARIRAGMEYMTITMRWEGTAVGEAANARSPLGDYARAHARSGRTNGKKVERPRAGHARRKRT